MALPQVTEFPEMKLKDKDWDEITRKSKFFLETREIERTKLEQIVASVKSFLYGFPAIG